MDANDPRMLATNACMLVLPLFGVIGGGMVYANWLRRPRKPKKPSERKSASTSGFKVIQGGQARPQPAPL